MPRRSLLGSFIGLVVVVVAGVAALHWAYQQLRAMWWLVLPIGLVVAVTYVWRRVRL